MDIRFTELGTPKVGGCEKLQCPNDATYEANWANSKGRKLLSTTHKTELERYPKLLGTWIKIGPR